MYHIHHNENTMHSYKIYWRVEKNYNFHTYCFFVDHRLFYILYFAFGQFFTLFPDNLIMWMVLDTNCNFSYFYWYIVCLVVFLCLFMFYFSPGTFLCIIHIFLRLFIITTMYTSTNWFVGDILNLFLPVLVTSLFFSCLRFILTTSIYLPSITCWQRLSVSTEEEKRK